MPMTSLAPTSAAAPAIRPRSVVIADDSVVVRGLFARWLTESGQFNVVSVAGDGQAAIEQAERHRPDLMVLDVEMPGVDGMAALPEIVRRSPNTAILLATTLTKRNAKIALHGMSLGATDVLAKPDTNRDLTTSLDFRSELLARLAAIRASAGSVSSGLATGHLPPAGPCIAATLDAIDLKPMISVLPRFLVIGASTGGPRAVSRVLKDVGAELRHLTTLVVQHMPPVFTSSFAEQISGQTGLIAREPFDGERLMRGTIYVAPGGRHLGIDRRLGHIVAAISDAPPVRFCRPAVDVLFQETARHVGSAALGLILTGMGSDGTDGAAALRRAGACVLVQDEATSVVWGMPGSVVRAGHASRELPLGAIGPSLRLLLGGEARP